MNAISTRANDCSEEPKISASEREASTSSPMETAPVRATMAPAQRNVPGRVTSGSVTGADSSGCGCF